MRAGRSNLTGLSYKQILKRKSAVIYAVGRLEDLFKVSTRELTVEQWVAAEGEKAIRSVYPELMDFDCVYKGSVERGENEGEYEMAFKFKRVQLQKA